MRNSIFEIALMRPGAFAKSEATLQIWSGEAGERCEQSSGFISMSHTLLAGMATTYDPWPLSHSPRNAASAHGVRAPRTAA